jgi:hypothetical protein
MRRYRIRPVVGPMPLIGRLAGTPWAGAHVLRVHNYPWQESGRKQSTTVRMLYSRRALYVQFRCLDRHIHSRVTELNGMVCEDSCVELFAAPRADVGAAYFNLEINGCGCMHLGCGTGRQERTLATPELASGIRIVTSIAAATKDESPKDRSWWVAAALPYTVLSELTGLDVRPRSGHRWRGNCYRCGGRTDAQYACWSPIDWPRPDFHRPEFFGEFRFE